MLDKTLQAIMRRLLNLRYCVLVFIDFWLTDW